VAIPIGLYFVLKREWKLLLTCGTIVTLFFLIYMVMVADGWASVTTFFASAGQFRDMLFGEANHSFPFYPYRSDFGATALTEVGVLVRYWIPGAARILPGLYLVIWGICVTIMGIVVIRKREIGMLHCVALFFLLYLTFYTQSYDTILAVTLLFGTIYWSGGDVPKWVFGVNLLVFLPINGVVMALHLPDAWNFLYLTLPVAVAITAITVWWTVAQRAVGRSG
jgi:hypothetical protein